MNSSNETTTVTDPFFTAKRGWPAMVINTLCCLGVIGYLIYAYVIIKHRASLANPFYTLTLSMMIPDLLSLVGQIIYCVPAMLLTEARMPDTYRVIVGYFSDGAWFWSCSHMVVIGINRVCAIYFFQRYQQMFTLTRIRILIVLCWAFGFVMVSMMYVCTCEYYFESYTWGFECKPNSCADTSLMVNQYISMSMIIGVVVMYILVFVRVRQTSRKVAGASGSNDKQSKREIQLVLQFLVIGISLTVYYLLFWTVPPLMKAGLVSDFVGLNFMNMFGIMFSCLHPFLYIFFGSEVKSKLFGVSGDKDGKTRMMNVTIQETVQ